MKSSSFIKGAAAGLAIGSAAAVLFDPISNRQRRKLQRKAEGVFKNIGTMIDNAIGMF